MAKSFAAKQPLTPGYVIAGRVCHCEISTGYQRSLRLDRTTNYSLTLALENGRRLLQSHDVTSFGHSEIQLCHLVASLV